MEQKKASKYEIDMCNGPILSKMLLFALPLMASSILQLLFNAADTIVVGKFAGDHALAAVGSNGSLINLLVNLFMGLSVGTNVLVARYHAAKQEKDLQDTIHTSVFLSMISGVFLAIVGFISARILLEWMQTPEEVIDLSTLYLRIYFLGMIALMVYNFGAAILRAVGDTRRPLYYLTFSGVINVVLNLIFVIGFHMSVAGVALATVISEGVSAGLVLRCLIKNEGGIHLEWKRLRIHKDKFLKILQIGLPASVQGIVFALSNVIIQSSVNSFGAITVAGNSAAANIEGFVYVAMNAFHQTAISFVSQNYGAGKQERLNRIVICAQLSVIVVGLLLGNLAVVFGRPLLGMYTSNEVVMEAGMHRLSVICRTYALCGVMDVMVGALRGLGCAMLPTFVSMIGACGLRLLWIFTFFQMDVFHSVFSLYMTYPVSWILTGGTHMICYLLIRKRMEKQKA